MAQLGVQFFSHSCPFAVAVAAVQLVHWRFSSPVPSSAQASTIDVGFTTAALGAVMQSAMTPGTGPDGADEVVDDGGGVS
jgi:hypothetical protein